MVVKTWCGDLTSYSCWIVLFASPQNRSIHFFAYPPISKDQATVFHWSVSLFLWWSGFLIVPCDTSFSMLWVKQECNTSTTKSQRSEPGVPSMRNPASRETTSDSIELCETEVCFLHIQPPRTNVRRPKMHWIHTRKRLCRFPQSLNLRTIPDDNAVLYYPHGNIVCDHLYYERDQRAKHFAQALVHFVTARSSLFTDQQCQVYQIVPQISLSGRFDKTSNSCSIREIVPRISSGVLP